MQHDDSVYLGHMLETAVKAVTKLGDRSRTDFDDNEDLRIVLTIRPATAKWGGGGPRSSNVSKVASGGK
jgi:hypothetical protein